MRTLKIRVDNYPGSDPGFKESLINTFTELSGKDVVFFANDVLFLRIEGPFAFLGHQIEIKNGKTQIVIAVDSIESFTKMNNGTDKTTYRFTFHNKNTFDITPKN